MAQSFQTERLNAQRTADVSRAAQILRNGGIVAFPTETVYGLGANALDAAAVEKIFLAKQRPHWDPLIVHIDAREMLAQVADLGRTAPASKCKILNDPGAEKFSGLSSEAEANVRRMIDRFWPGPLTILLPRTPAVPDAVTAGRPLVGVRMPAHPVALELIRQAGVPVAAPSANTFGHTSPTTASHVAADLDGRIDAILDGGPTEIGLESTVVEPTDQGVRIYRPGKISVVDLEAVLDWAELYLPSRESPSQPEALPSPGFGLRHYAPRARLILVTEIDDKLSAKSQVPAEDALVAAVDSAFDGVAVIGVMLPTDWNPSCAQIKFHWGEWHDQRVLARNLFAGLRELDDAGATTIICPVPELPGIGEAIRDRLRKAARPR